MVNSTVNNTSDTTGQPSDVHARQQALDPRGSFAVAAPAGSGKTGLLTQRVLRLLACCDHPEEILCITFTRKAAGEMQARITQAIINAAREPEPDNPHDRATWSLARAVLERDKARGWQLLKSPNRLRIQTIDGLCRALTKQLPLSSGLGALPDTLDQPEFAYRQAVRELLKLLEQDTPLREDLERLLVHLDNNLENTENLLVTLLQKRDQWLQLLLAARQDNARQYLQQVLETLVNESLQHARDLLNPWGSDLALLADFAGTNLLGDNSAAPLTRCSGLTALPETSPDQLPLWLGLLDMLLTKDGWRKRLTKKEGFPAGGNKAEKEASKARKEALLNLIAELAEQTAILPTLQLLRTLPPALYLDSQWQLLDSLTRLLPLLVAQLTLVFKNLGATDFNEITQAALRALGDEESPTEVALKLDYQIRHILVDEFQDTASPQLQLLEKLTAGWQYDDGRTLFIVGDGMQSCYGFRDANVGIFLDARRQGIGHLPLQALDLTVNFRSQGGVVDWVNRVFLNAFPAEDDISRGAVRYANSEAFKPAMPIEAVRCFACIGSEDGDTSGRDIEAQQVLALIRQTRQLRPDDTIAILVRNRSHLRETLATLNKAGISWQATEIDPLSSRMAIVDLISLTRALLNPADRIAWLSVLRAPWCGLDLHDLYTLVNTDLGTANPHLNGQDYPVILGQVLLAEQLTGISDEGQQCLQRLGQVIRESWRQRRRKSLRVWLEGTWLALGGPSSLLEVDDLENAQSFFALLEQHGRAGQIPDWNNFIAAVERLYAAPRKDADPKLQVMTIHKSKGLEFDTVIIPGLDKQPRQDEQQLLLWQERITAEGEKQLLLSPLAATGEDPDPLYGFMRQEKALKDRLEATRLLYVGCTRAIKQLFLLAEVKTSGDGGELRKPAKQSLLAPIWDQIHNHVECLQTAPSTTTLPAEQNDLFLPAVLTPEQQAKSTILRLPEGWQRPALVESKLLAHYRGQEFEDEENLPEPDTLDNRQARHLGTVLHRCLQRITLDGVEQWDPQRIERQQPFWELQLQQLGLYSPARSQAVATIRQAVEQILADPTGRWLLNHQLEESQCELALWHTQGDKVRQKIIDRTFVDQGIRWIVDYKSAAPQTGEALESFLTREVDHYRDQLAGYRQLFLQLDKNPIRCALYFPLIQHLQVVEIDTCTTSAH